MQIYIKNAMKVSGTGREREGGRKSERGGNERERERGREGGREIEMDKKREERQ